MKKYLALFLTLVLVGTMSSLWVSAEEDTTPITDGFEFDIANVDTKIVGAKGLILTSQDAYNNSGAGWAINILCEKVANNLYKAKQDAAFSSVGQLPALTLGADDIVISIHSDGVDANKEQKKQAMKVKAGMYFTLSGIDLTKSGAVEGKAKLSVNNPQEPAPVQETITIDGVLNDTGWKEGGWTHATTDNTRLYDPNNKIADRNDTFDFQFRADDTKLYVALKSNNKPFGTADINGNGKGTQFRLWIFNDGYKDNAGNEFTTYNYFIDLKFVDGTVSVFSKQNTVITETQV
jgi:hypothetical protein